jgi:hypothetical protein
LSLLRMRPRPAIRKEIARIMPKKRKPAKSHRVKRKAKAKRGKRGQTLAVGEARAL